MWFLFLTFLSVTIATYFRLTQENFENKSSNNCLLMQGALLMASLSYWMMCWTGTWLVLSWYTAKHMSVISQWKFQIFERLSCGTKWRASSVCLCLYILTLNGNIGKELMSLWSSLLFSLPFEAVSNLAPSFRKEHRLPLCTKEVPKNSSKLSNLRLQQACCLTNLTFQPMGGLENQFYKLISLKNSEYF